MAKSTSERCDIHCGMVERLADLLTKCSKLEIENASLRIQNEALRRIIEDRSGDVMIKAAQTGQST